MLTCTNCSVDISGVEIIERTAKSGKNMGQKYKARICADCGTFNFVNEATSTGLDNETLDMLKRIEGKVDVILQKMLGMHTVKDGAWEDFKDVEINS